MKGSNCSWGEDFSFQNQCFVCGNGFLWKPGRETKIQPNNITLITRANSKGKD